MPAYALICADENCAHTLEEVVLKVSEREDLRCPKCGGDLTNDYARHETSNFQLKGGGWPGKTGSMADKIIKERNSD